MKHVTYDGDVYLCEFRLSDAELNRLEVLRSKRLKDALRVEDYGSIEIFHAEDFDGRILLGQTLFKHQTIQLNRKLLSQPLESARLTYLHELAHALLMRQGHPPKFGGHDYHFLVLLGALLIRAKGGDFAALWALRLYDVSACIVDGVRVAEHPIYSYLLLADICPFFEFTCFDSFAHYSYELAMSKRTAEEITAAIIAAFA